MNRRQALKSALGAAMLAGSPRRARAETAPEASQAPTIKRLFPETGPVLFVDVARPPHGSHRLIVLNDLRGVVMEWHDCNWFDLGRKAVELLERLRTHGSHPIGKLDISDDRVFVDACHGPASLDRIRELGVYGDLIQMPHMNITEGWRTDENGLAAVFVATGGCEMSLRAYQRQLRNEGVVG